MEPQEGDPQKVDAAVPAVTNPVEPKVPADQGQAQQVDQPKVPAVDPQVPDADQPQQVEPAKVDAPVQSVTKPVDPKVPADQGHAQQVDQPKVDAPVPAVDPQVPDADPPHQVQPAKVDVPVPSVTNPVDPKVTADQGQAQQVDQPKVDAPVPAVDPQVPEALVDPPKDGAQEPQGGTQGKNFDFVSSLVLKTFVLNIQM